MKVLVLQTVAYSKWKSKIKKNKKKVPQQYEGKSAFQTIAIELYKQSKTKTIKKHIRLVMLDAVMVVAKADNEILCFKQY